MEPFLQQLQSRIGNQLNAGQPPGAPNADANFPAPTSISSVSPAIQKLMMLRQSASQPQPASQAPAQPAPAQPAPAPAMPLGASQVPGQSTPSGQPSPQEMDQMIQIIAQQYGLDPAQLAQGVAQVLGGQQ